MPIPSSLAPLLAHPVAPWLLAPVGVYAVSKLAQWFVPGPQHLPTFNYQDKTVLITGASTGLGRSLATVLYRKGARLILVARSVDKLKELTTELIASGKGSHDPVYAYFDLAEPDKVGDLIKLSTTGVIDVLINNAGISMRGGVEETDISVHRRVMEVNYFGQVVVTRAILPFIPNDGMIILVSSLQAKMALPYRSAYCASKHAVQGFIDSLRGENRWGLHILNVAAGYIQTDLGLNALDTFGRPTGKTDDHIKNGLLPDEAANIIVAAGEQRELELVMAPVVHRSAVFLRWAWPSLYFYLVHRRAMKERAKVE